MQKCWGSACQGTSIICNNNCKQTVQSWNIIPDIDVANNSNGLVNSAELTTSIHALCDTLTNTNHSMSDDSNGMQGIASIVSNQPICCRGSFACQEVGLYQTSEQKHPIVCSGRESCSSTIIQNIAGDVVCDAASACNRECLLLGILELYVLQYL